MAAACAAAATIAIVVGCGTSDPLPAAVSTTTPPQQSFVPAEGPCATEGQVRECHVKLGERDGVLDCYQGVQECRGGVWTSCGGKDITLSSINHGVAPGTEAPESHGGGVAMRAVATSTGGQCALDPCNPYCAAYNLDSGLTPEAGAAAYFVSLGSPFGGAPTGFASKSDCSPCNSGFPKDCNGSPTHFTSYDACLADHHCDTATGKCVPNWVPDDWKWPAAECPGVDVTVSAACEIDGVPGFNVCNRGNSDMVAATVGLYVVNGNAEFDNICPKVMGTPTCSTCPVKAASCSPAVPGGVLKPGKCMRVTQATCPAWSGGTGNPVAYVNSAGAIAECGGTKAGTGSTAPGCNNNWADVKHKGTVCGGVGSTLATTTYTQQYTASCPIGFNLSWKFLTYDAVIGCSPGACTGTNGSTIEFFGQLQDLTSDGGAGAVSPATASLIKKVTQTETCTLSGPTGCPVNLLTWSGGAPQSSYERLTLTIVLTPTADKLAGPRLNTWAVSYDCVPTE